MFGCISFCIGDKCIEINGKKLSLGDLTTEFLNLPKDKYAAMRKQLELAQKKANKYIKSKKLSDWYDANEEYIKLDSMICEIPCLALVREETDIFEEARQLTAQMSMFEDDDCELTDYDLEVLNKITTYEDYLEHPENYGGTNKEYYRNTETDKVFCVTSPQPPIPEPPPEKTRALLIFPGNIVVKWKYYKDYCDAYAQALYDIESFNNTIFNFIKFFLSSTEKMNADSYASALYDFFNFPRADKLIANPIRGTGLFTANDQVIMRHMPRETFEGSGIKDKQPNAVIFIQANLHVSKSRSDSDKVVNNIAINGLNAELSKLADGKRIFYLDANILFDDEAGGLSADKSEDSTHLYAKYYKEWGEWIVKQTASLIGER